MVAQIWGGGLGLPWWEQGKCYSTKGHPGCSPTVGGSLDPLWMQRRGDLARGHLDPAFLLPRLRSATKWLFPLLLFKNPMK